MILDRQLDRRSPNKKKRTYIIGRRYLVEKQALDDVSRFDSPFHQSDGMGKSDKNETAVIIGKQVGLGQATVERAAKFTEAVDRIIHITGIKVNDLLARRNINAITRNDLIGRRYTVEKSRWGDLERVKSASHQNDDLGKPKTQTRFKIADQVGVGAATVERAEKLSKAIDVITAKPYRV